MGNIIYEVKLLGRVLWFGLKLIVLVNWRCLFGLLSWGVFLLLFDVVV